MNDDRMLEFMAQMSDYMRATDQRFERLDQHFERMERNIEQLITVMHNGFERVVAQASQTNQRLDTPTDEIREAKTEAQTTNRRLQATFDHAGHLTKENTAKEARLVKLETDNTELRQRLSVVEEFMRRAS